MAQGKRRSAILKNRNIRKASEYRAQEASGSTQGSRYRERVKARGYPTMRMCDHVRTASGLCQHAKEDRRQDRTG